MTGGTGQLVKSRKINYLQGRASFLDAHTLKIEKAEGGQETLAFQHAVLATGSRPATIPSLALDSERVMDSTSALELKDIPKSLLVIGGGYIGLELGTVYAALGSRVSVVEMLPGLLPGADRDLVRVLAKRLEGHFHAIMLNTTVAEMQEVADGVHAKFKGEAAPTSASSAEPVRRRTDRPGAGPGQPGLPAPLLWAGLRLYLPLHPAGPQGKRPRLVSGRRAAERPGHVGRRYASARLVLASLENGWPGRGDIDRLAGVPPCGTGAPHRPPGTAWCGAYAAPGHLQHPLRL
jgi:hypothetical protein